MTEQQEEAWDDYFSITHADLNQHLRDGVSLDEQESALVERLDASLAAAPRTEEPYATYRGISTLRVTGDGGRSGVPAQQWIEQNAQVGSQVTLPGYASTTLDADMAGRFAGTREEYSLDGVVFEIETTQGGYQGQSPEMEVTLARDSAFEVTGVSTEQVDGEQMSVVRLRERPSA